MDNQSILIYQDQLDGFYYQVPSHLLTRVKSPGYIRRKGLIYRVSYKDWEKYLKARITLTVEQQHLSFIINPQKYEKELPKRTIKLDEIAVFHDDGTSTIKKKEDE